MADPRPLRWLHLSDLHLGCRGRATMICNGLDRYAESYPAGHPGS
jgi:hypothetical protein